MLQDATTESGATAQAAMLGSYDLVGLLGRGGMGEVWQVRHRVLASGAAVKLLRPGTVMAADDLARMLEQFEWEAQATAALSSPHTVRVFDFGITGDGVCYYVMELLQGRNLETLVQTFGPLPSERVIHLLCQVCHSLSEAHAHGLIHGDVKPANIYTCRVGLEYDFAKVIDFGLVKAEERSAADAAGADMRTLGTPAYMAPEVIHGKGAVDRRADVYALGCVAYYLLTGQLVFDARTARDVMVHHIRSEPTPPSQRTELPVPRDVDALVMACLHKDPARRPADAREVLQMARRCRNAHAWDQAQARDWWDTHLPEITELSQTCARWTAATGASGRTGSLRTDSACRFGA